MFVYLPSEKIFPSASLPFLLTASENVPHGSSPNPSIKQLKITIRFHSNFFFPGCPKAILSVSDGLCITHSQALDYYHRSTAGLASVCEYLCTAEHSAAHMLSQFEKHKELKSQQNLYKQTRHKAQFKNYTRIHLNTYFG